MTAIDGFSADSHTMTDGENLTFPTVRDALRSFNEVADAASANGSYAARLVLQAEAGEMMRTDAKLQKLVYRDMERLYGIPRDRVAICRTGVLSSFGVFEDSYYIQVIL